jgi:hypothetical protein
MAPPQESKISRNRAPEPALKRLLRAVQRRWAKSVTGPLFSRFNTVPVKTGQTESPQAMADQRRQPRIYLTNTSVHVTDGCLFATARIGNISPSGICLCNLPEQLYRSAGRLTVFSSDDPGLPVLHIEPRWEQTGWSGKTIGAAILNASETWRLFFVHTASQIEA